MKKAVIIKKLIQVCWLLIAVGAIILFGAAMQRKKSLPCQDIKVNILGSNGHIFLDEKEILHILSSQQIITTAKSNAVKLRSLEQEIKKNAWVQSAELYLDNNNILQVDIVEREPICRVFTHQQMSFYMDSTGARLPISDKLTIRLPVITGFPSGNDILSAPDSALLQDVLFVSKQILQDSFWVAQSAQIDINDKGEFDIIPAIGEQLIHLGKVNDLARKLNNLKTFYKQAWLQNGVNTYSKLDARYLNQIVAVKRGWIDTVSAISNVVKDSLPRIATTYSTNSQQKNSISEIKTQSSTLNNKSIRNNAINSKPAPTRPVKMSVKRPSARAVMQKKAEPKK